MTKISLRYCDETLEFKDKLEAGFLELGKRLANIRDNRLYEGKWDNFELYLMEFKNLSESTATKLINIYKKFVVEYGIKESDIVKAGGWSLLAETLPVVSNKKEAQHWVHSAGILNRTDLRRSIRETMTGVEMKDCKHQWVTFRLCTCCGLRERVYDKN